jgi:hypothetical protein
MKRSSMLVAVASLLIATFAAPAQTPRVAATPPMGWNSWDAYGLTITEQQFRDDVKVLHEKLQPFGWNYAVIDEGWFFYNPEDRNKPDTLHYAIDPTGRYIPVPARFPSADISPNTPIVVQSLPKPAGTPEPKLAATMGITTFKPLADYVHSLGLKFGIHIVRGIPRASVERDTPIANSAFHATDAADTSDACPWDPTNWGVKDNAAGQAWYDSLLTQYADWGIDLLKVDCISNNPYKADEIRMIRRAIDKVTAKTGRPIVLSLSPGPTNLSHAAEVTELSNMWRISNDIWDVWANRSGWPVSVSSQFARTAAWAQYSGPGHWPDADMLPLGELRPNPGEGRARATKLTPDEQQTLMTLWSMARSPLILGANLTLLDDPTLKLLTNRDLIRIDQTATASRQLFHTGDLIAWSADLPPNSPAGSIALAIFNVGDTPAAIDPSFATYTLPAATYRARDVWAGKDLGKLKSLPTLTLAPHSSTLYLLKK